MLLARWHPLCLARVFMSLMTRPLQTVEQQQAGDLEIGLEQRPKASVPRAIVTFQSRAGPRYRIVGGDIGRGIGTVQVQLVADALRTGGWCGPFGSTGSDRPSRTWPIPRPGTCARRSGRSSTSRSRGLQAIEGVLSDPAEAERSDASAFGGRRATASRPA